MSLEVAGHGSLQWLQKRSDVVLGEDEPLVVIEKSRNPAGVLPYLPEVRVIQSQHGAYQNLINHPVRH